LDKYLRKNINEIENANLFLKILQGYTLHPYLNKGPFLLGITVMNLLVCGRKAQFLVEFMIMIEGGVNNI